MVEKILVSTELSENAGETQRVNKNIVELDTISCSRIHVVFFYLHVPYKNQPNVGKRNHTMDPLGLSGVQWKKHFSIYPKNQLKITKASS